MTKRITQKEACDLVEEPPLVSHINQKQLSQRWGISARTLEHWRWKGIGPDYLKLGSRAIYRVADIEEFELRNHQIVSQQIVPQYQKSVQLTPEYQKKLDSQKMSEIMAKSARTNPSATAPSRPAPTEVRKVDADSES